MERFFPALAAAALCSLAACATAPRSAQPALADGIAVQLPVAAGSLPGSLFRAAGAGPHPTVVWFHGFPGLPAPVPAVADALRDTGVNVLYVHYRGSWGVPGGFSPDHALEDAAATLARVRAAPAAWRVDPRHVIAGGDSFGSWVALQAAAADPAIACVATALVLDLGRLGRDLGAGQPMRMPSARCSRRSNRTKPWGIPCRAAATGC